MLLIPGIDKINTNIDTNLENKNNNNNISNNNKDDSDTFTMSESSINSSSITDNKTISNNNFPNKSIDNQKNVLKTYIKKLTTKFEDKKVSFNIDDNNHNNKSNKHNSRKNSILSLDILRNTSQNNSNMKLNALNSASNNSIYRISNLKNYPPNLQNNLNNSDNQIKRIQRNSYTKRKINNSIESIKEKISSIADEMLIRIKNKRIEENKDKFIRSNIRHKTLISTITSPLIYSNKIKDEEFMDIINDNFSLSDNRNSYTKDNIDLNLLVKRYLLYNNIDSINSQDDLNSSISNYIIPKENLKEKILEKSPYMKKYRISSSFPERQMKRLQMKNNNINILRKKLEKKNKNIFSPKIDSFSQKLIEQKGIYIPPYKRPVNIQYDKNLKFNLFLKMKKENELKKDHNKENKGFLSSRVNKKNSNIKIVNFFESQISWKEKVNYKTKKLGISLEKEKEKALKEELAFKPKILNNSEYKRKYKTKSIFMKLYHDQSIKEKKLEKLKKKLTPSFTPNINNEKSLNYYNKNNINVCNNYSNFHANNTNNTLRLMNNISINFEKLNKILYYEEENSSANLSNKLKNYEMHEISKIKKDDIKKVELNDTITSLTRLDSDKENNKYPNINESNFIFIGHDSYNPKSERSIIYNQNNKIKSNYKKNANKNEILKNKIRYKKERKYYSKIKEKNLIPNKFFFSFLKGNDNYNKNKSMEIQSRKVKKNNDNLLEQLGKLNENLNSKIIRKSKSELSYKEIINKTNREQTGQIIYFDLWEFNENQEETLGQNYGNEWKKTNNDYSKIMKEKKEKIKQYIIYRTNFQK